MGLIKRFCGMLAIGTCAIALTGCGPQINVGMNEDGSGVYECTFKLDKDYVAESGYLNGQSIDEVADIIESKFDETLNLKLIVDKEADDENDILKVSYSYKSVEDLNNHAERTMKIYNQMNVGYNIYEIYGCSPEEDKIADFELEALVEYLEENGVAADTDNRNCRKLIKHIREYLVKNGSYISKTGNSREVEFLNRALDAKDKKDDPYVKITTKDGVSKLNIDYMGLNYLEMYVHKLVQKNKGEIFNEQYIDEISEKAKVTEKKELLKRAYASFNLAGKIKNAIAFKEGTVSSQYSIDSFSPVMTVKLFDEKACKELTKLYNKEFAAMEEEKKNDTSAIKSSLKEIEDKYEDALKNYSITYGSNKIEFNEDELFELYNDESYVSIELKTDKDIKEHNNVITEGMDESPLAGDEFNASVSLGILCSGFVLMICGVLYASRRPK